MEPLRFLHIPKTGGSTFASILEYEYRGKKSFEFSGHLPADRKRFEALPETERENIMLFTGHAPIVTGIPRVDRATTITILRDPVSRVKSYCQYVSEGKIPDYPAEKFNLDSLLRSGNAELSNFQTRLLLKDGLTESFESLSPSEARDEALDNLFNRVSYFGLQEYFDESLIVFRSALKWSMPIYLSLNRKNADKLLRFEQRHLERIAEMNTIDIEVYNAAKEKFLRSFGRSLLNRVRLKWFQRRNRRATILISKRMA